MIATCLLFFFVFTFFYSSVLGAGGGEKHNKRNRQRCNSGQKSRPNIKVLGIKKQDLGGVAVGICSCDMFTFVSCVVDLQNYELWEGKDQKAHK